MRRWALARRDRASRGRSQSRAPRSALLVLGALAVFWGTAVPAVWADPPAVTSDQCVPQLVVARQYVALLKQRADHYEVALAELRATLTDLENQVKDLTAKVKAADTPSASTPRPTP